MECCWRGRRLYEFIWLLFCRCSRSLCSISVSVYSFPHAGRAVSRVPAPFRFYDFSICCLHIYLQKSSGGSLKNDATLHVAKSTAVFLLHWVCNIVCGWRGRRFLNEFVWLLLCRVSRCLCLISSSVWAFPPASTPFLVYLRFLVAFTIKVPDAARLKTTQRSILQNRVCFAKVILQHGVRLKGSPFV